MFVLTSKLDAMYSDYIKSFASEVGAIKHLKKIDFVIISAGILKYPNVCYE